MKEVNIMMLKEELYNLMADLSPGAFKLYMMILNGEYNKELFCSTFGYSESLYKHCRRELKNKGYITEYK